VAIAVEIRAPAFEPLVSLALWALFGKTIARALAVAALAVVLGVPLGFVLARTDVVGRRASLVVHAFPMFLPPFLLALGWSHAIGGALFGTAGLVGVLALAFAPIVTVLTALALAGIDPALEDAARVVASPWRVATRIALPIAWPSALLGALIVFALAFAELGVPMFLRVDAYPGVVFARLGGIDYAPGEAFALVLPLLAVAVALLAVERTVIGRRPFTVLGARRDHAVFALGRWRIAATLGVWLVAALGALPIVWLAARARLSEAWPWIGDSLRNSVVDGALGATAIAAVGLVAGHALARRQRGAAALDAVGVLAFVAPAAVLGVGLIAVWNRASTQVVYGSSAIVVVGYVARYTVFGIRPIAAAITQTPVHLEEAAQLTGAGYLRILATIVVPINRRALVGAWLLAFVFCLRDEMAILYYPPGGETLPVRIFTLEANGPPGIVAALATIQVAVTAIVIAVIASVFRGPSPGRR
jgi:iron(III) transport system permease protein